MPNQHDRSRAIGHTSPNSTSGEHCVELMIWRKSRYSTNGGECVEVAGCACHTIFVRDSKDPDGPRLSFSPEEWNAFTNQIHKDALGPRH